MSKDKKCCNKKNCGCSDKFKSLSYSNVNCNGSPGCGTSLTTDCVFQPNFGYPCIGINPGMSLTEILQLFSTSIYNAQESALTVQEEGVTVTTNTSLMNFLGSFVELTATGPNSVDIRIEGNLIADLLDTDDNAITDTADLATSQVLWEDSIPVSFPGITYPFWQGDIASTQLLTYTLVFNPVSKNWVPFNAKPFINAFACTLYTNNGFINVNAGGTRTVGLNDGNLTFTYSSTTNCSGQSSTVGARGFNVYLGANGGEGGQNGINLYSGQGAIRTNHTRIYSGQYKSRSDWANSVTSEPDVMLQNAEVNRGIHYTLLGFFNDTQNGQIPFAGDNVSGQRIPNTVTLQFFSNPMDQLVGQAYNSNQWYTPDATITKVPDYFDYTLGTAKETRPLVEGGGHLEIRRFTPNIHHNGSTTNQVGFGDIALIHGSGGGSNLPQARFRHTGQWKWHQYGYGNFTGPLAYILGVTNNDGEVIEITLQSIVQQHLLELNEQVVVAYALRPEDNKKLILLDDNSNTNLIVPNNTSEAIPIGFSCKIVRNGSGTITLDPEGGVTVNTAIGSPFGSQYLTHEIIKTDTDTWLLI